VTKGGAQGGERGKKTCYNCGSEDHGPRDCKKPNSNFAFAVCFTCGETGHLVRACPKNAQVGGCTS
jgi:zinc finger CCHC domain-containing protein 9